MAENVSKIWLRMSAKIAAMLTKMYKAENLLTKFMIFVFFFAVIEKNVTLGLITYIN